jgi:transcriptional regulator with XRE-family HTH domain
MDAARELDRALLAHNIRCWRMLRGFSQAELAARAGVSITTLYKAESARIVRIGFLQKIVRQGLEGSFEECCSTMKLSNAKPADALYVKHDRRETKWFVYGDRRRTVPEEALQQIQNLSERIRLGKLGFATLFGCGTSYLMPDGPGMLLYEVHGPTDPVNQNYRDAIYYALRGSVVIGINGEEVRLAEGESIGLEGTTSITMDLAEPLQAGQLPPLVQFIGANRVGRLPQSRKLRG